MKRTVRRRGDKSYGYLSLVEAVRVEGRSTHTTLLRLGEVSELRSSGQLDRIIKALSSYANGTYVEAGEHRVEVVTRRNAAQAKVLNALGVDTSTWDKASIA